MKKLLCLLTAIAVLFTCSISAFATGSGTDDVQSASSDESAEIEALRDESVQIPLEDENGNSVMRVVGEDGLVTVRYYVDEVVTSATRSFSNETFEGHVGTTIDIVYDPAASVTPYADDVSQYKEGWDDTGAVKFYTRVYYTQTYGAGTIRYLDITKVTGGYTRQDNGFSIESQVLTIEQTGYTSSGAHSGTQSVSQSMGSSSSYTRVVPTSWVAVSSVNGKVGATMYYSVRRVSTGSTWGGQLNNYPVNS